MCLLTGASELHDLLKPYLLRRTKEVVLKDLPKKSDLVMYHGISKVQKKLYKALLTKDISKAAGKLISCFNIIVLFFLTFRLKYWNIIIENCAVVVMS